MDRNRVAIHQCHLSGQGVRASRAFGKRCAQIMEGDLDRLYMNARHLSQEARLTDHVPLTYFLRYLPGKCDGEVIQRPRFLEQFSLRVDKKACRYSSHPHD